MTVEEMGRRMSQDELAEWRAFDRIEPIVGERRGDMHAAMICSTLYNMMRSKKSPALKPDDFLLFRDETPPDEMALADKIAGVMNEIGVKSEKD